MKTRVIAALAGLFLFYPTFAIAGDQPGKILIAEETVRTISARMYANLLLQAYEKGWRYPEKQIEAGFRHHFDELRQQLIAQGFTIIATDDQQVDTPSPAGQVL